MTASDILVLGVGNLVLQDEGVGIHAVQALEHETLPPGVELLDGGTGGIFLIGTLQAYRHLILIDATLDEHPPGTVRRLHPRYSDDYPTLLSAHEIGLKDMIDAMLIQERIPDIELIAVSVKAVGNIGMGLSPEVEKALPVIVETVRRIIGEIGAN